MPILQLIDLSGPGAPGSVLHAGQVYIGGVIFGATDNYGVEFILESLKGWSDSVSSTGTTEQRPGAHGGWVSPAFYGPRVIELAGSLVASTWDGAEAAVDRLMGAVSLDALAPLLVATNSRALQAMVRQEGDPLVDIVGGHASVSLSLVAPDPRRYSTFEASLGARLPATSGGLSLPLTPPLTVGATVISGSIQAINEGNLPTPATFTIYGPCAPATLTNLLTGQQMKTIDAIPAGRTLVMDGATQEALLDGTAPRAVSGAWFDIQPGLNEIAFTATSYDPASLLEVTFRSAWR